MVRWGGLNWNSGFPRVNWPRFDVLLFSMACLVVVGDRRCAGCGGIIPPAVGLLCNDIVQASNRAESENDALSTVWEPRVMMLKKRETRRKASTVGERVAMVVLSRYSSCRQQGGYIHKCSGC